MRATRGGGRDRDATRDGFDRARSSRGLTSACVARTARVRDGDQGRGAGEGDSGASYTRARCDADRCARSCARLVETWEIRSNEGLTWPMKLSMDRSQAPLQQFGTSGRYATALYVAATKAGNLKTVEGELEQVREATSETTRARGSLLQRQTTETDGAFTISFVPAHEFGGEGS